MVSNPELRLPFNAEGTPADVMRPPKPPSFPSPRVLEARTNAELAERSRRRREAEERAAAARPGAAPPKGGVQVQPHLFK